MQAHIEFAFRMGRDGFSVEAALAKGRKPPKWYLERPEPTPDADFYLEAFDDLSSCRVSLDPMGSIPWDRIVQYGYYRGLDADMLKAFVRIVRMMDQKFIELAVAQQKKEMEAARG